MIQNFLGSGGGVAYDASVTPAAETSTITFGSIPANPKAWALIFMPMNGATLSGLGSTKYITAYVKGGELDMGIVTNSTAISVASTISASYDADEQEFTLTASGGNKFIHGQSMTYRLIYTI